MWNRTGSWLSGVQPPKRQRFIRSSSRGSLSVSNTPRVALTVNADNQGGGRRQGRRFGDSPGRQGRCRLAIPVRGWTPPGDPILGEDSTMSLRQGRSPVLLSHGGCHPHSAALTDSPSSNSEKV